VISVSTDTTHQEFAQYSHACEFARTPEGFRAEYPLWALTFSATRVTAGRGSLWADVTVRDSVGYLVCFTRLNLLDRLARQKLAQGLDRDRERRAWSGVWSSLLEDFAARVVDAWRAQEQAASEATMTASDLLQQDFPDPKWAVPELLPEGLTLLAGKPKTGKSWWALNVALAVATGGLALGRIRCEPGRVLYLALEDSPRRLKQRVDALLRGTRPEGLDRLELATSWPTLDQGGLERLEARLKAELRVVVLDTLARVRGRTDGRENLYQADYGALAPLADLARSHQVAILAVHHLRKAHAEDILDLVSGSAALTGAADSVLLLRRARGSEEATLFVTGRDIEEQELALRFADRCLWVLQGPAQQVAATREQQEALRTVQALGGEASPKEVAQVLGISPTAARLRMARLAQEGFLVVTTRGRYALPETDQVRERLRTDERLNGRTDERLNASDPRSLEAFNRSSVHEGSRTLANPDPSPPEDHPPDPGPPPGGPPGSGWALPDLDPGWFLDDPDPGDPEERCWCEPAM
jgi:RecA-family ATPase